MASFLCDQFVCQVGGGERKDRPQRERKRASTREHYVGLVKYPNDKNKSKSSTAGKSNIQ